MPWEAALEKGKKTKKKKKKELDFFILSMFNGGLNEQVKYNMLLDE